MSNLPLIALRELTNAGNAGLAGGKMGFYVSETSTPKPVFSDAELTNPLPNPVVADGNGRFPTIYMIPGEPYTVELTDADGAMVNSEDGLYATLLTSDSYLLRIKQIASNPLDYGAAGDGANDESAAVQAAIDFANANGGGVVNLLGLTYRVDSTLTLYSNVKLVGPGTLDFTGCPDEEYLKAQGTLGTAYSLTSDAAYRSAVVEASTSGFSAGDMVSIRSNQAVIGLVTSGEVNRINEVAGDEHYLASTLLDDYNTADTAVIQEVTPVENLVIEDIDIIASIAASGTAPSAIYLERCRNVELRNVRITGVKTFGVQIRQCMDVSIEGGRIELGGHGVRVGHGSRDVTLNGVKLERLVYGVSTQSFDSPESGTVHGLKINHCTFRRCLGDYQLLQNVTGARVRFNTHDHGGFLRFAVSDGVMAKNTFASDDPYEVQLPTAFINRSARPWNITIDDNEFDCPVLIEGNHVVRTGDGGSVRTLAITDNECPLGFDFSLTWDQSSAISADRVVVSGNEGAADSEINVTASGSSATIHRLDVSRNKVGAISVTSPNFNRVRAVRCDRNEVESDKTSLVSIGTVRSVRARGNNLIGSTSTTTYGLHTQGGTLVDLVSNRISGVSGSGAGIAIENIASGASVQCRGNTISVATAIGIYLSLGLAGADAHVSDNTVLVGAATAIYATSNAVSANVLQVADNLASGNPGSGDHMLHVAGRWTHVGVQDNTLRRGNTADSNVHFDAASVGAIDRVTLDGNTLQGGTYGVEFTNGNGQCWWSGGQITASVDEFLGAVGRRVLASLGPGTTVEANSLDTGVPLPGGAVTIPGGLIRAGDEIEVEATVWCRNDSGDASATGPTVQCGSSYGAGSVLSRVENLPAGYGVLLIARGRRKFPSAGTYFVPEWLSFYGQDASGGSANAGIGGAALQDMIGVSGVTSISFSTASDWTLGIFASWSGANRYVRVMNYTVKLLREGT